MKAESTNPELGRLILEVVENQTRDHEPPETRQMANRTRRPTPRERPVFNQAQWSDVAALGVHDDFAA